MSKTVQVKVCYGVSSKIDQYNHVIMLDYDNVDLKDVLIHVIEMQKQYNLSDFYIIKSTHGFNVICLDMLPISLICSIGNAIESPADRDFFKYGADRQYLTLRFDCDKELLGIVTNKSKAYIKSLAHKKFLEFYFDILIHDSNFDDNDKIDIIQYPSNKNGYHLVDKTLPSYLIGGEYDKPILSR